MFNSFYNKREARFDSMSAKHDVTSLTLVMLYIGGDYNYLWSATIILRHLKQSVCAN